MEIFQRLPPSETVIRAASGPVKNQHADEVALLARVTALQSQMQVLVAEQRAGNSQRPAFKKRTSLL